MCGQQYIKLSVWVGIGVENESVNFDNPREGNRSFAPISKEFSLGVVCNAVHCTPASRDPFS